MKEHCAFITIPNNGPLRPLASELVRRTLNIDMARNSFLSVHMLVTQWILVPVKKHSMLAISALLILKFHIKLSLSAYLLSQIQSFFGTWASHLRVRHRRVHYIPLNLNGGPEHQLVVPGMAVIPNSVFWFDHLCRSPISFLAVDASLYVWRYSTVPVQACKPTIEHILQIHRLVQRSKRIVIVVKCWLFSTSLVDLGVHSVSLPLRRSCFTMLRNQTTYFVPIWLRRRPSHLGRLVLRDMVV